MCEKMNSTYSGFIAKEVPILSCHDHSQMSHTWRWKKMEEAFTHFTLFTLFTPLCGLNLLNHISQLGPSCDGWFFPQPAAVHQGRWWSLLWRIGSAFDGFIMGTTTTNSLRPGRSSCKKMGTFESPSINTSTGSAQLAFLYIYIYNSGIQIWSNCRVQPIPKHFASARGNDHCTGTASWSFIKVITV